MDLDDAALKPSLRSAAATSVVEQLREAIINGHIAAGTPLVELDLAERMGVSRGPIREALRKLSYEGLVTLRPSRSAIVTSVHAGEVLEVYAMRRALGSIAIRHLVCTDMVTPSLMSRLHTFADRSKTKSARTNQRLLVKHDLGLQTAIVECSCLPRVSAKFRDLTTEIQLFVTSLGIVYPYVDRILDEHARLLDAIAAKDVEAADMIWQSRIRTAVSEFLELLPVGHQFDAPTSWVF